MCVSQAARQSNTAEVTAELLYHDSALSSFSQSPTKLTFELAEARVEVAVAG